MNPDVIICMIKEMSCFSENMLRTLDSYEYNESSTKNKHMLEWTKSQQDNVEILIADGNKISFDQIEEWRHQNTDFVKKFNTEIIKLKETKTEIEFLKISLEKQIKTCRQKLSDTQDKQNRLQEKRFIILVYKLLTNTNFIYSSKNVTGYVGENSEDKINCFNLNIQRYSPQEITEKLYYLIKDTNSKETAIMKVNEDIL